MPLSSETFNSKEKEFCIVFDVASICCFCPDWWKEVFFGEIRLYQRERGFSQAVAQVNHTALNTLLLGPPFSSFLARSFIFFLPSGFKPLVDCSQRPFSFQQLSGPLAAEILLVLLSSVAIWLSGC